MLSPSPPPRLCPQCREAFEAIGRTRVYCSDACRCRAAYQRSKTGAAPSYERSCLECGRTFTTASAGELVCSDGCRRARDSARELRRLREPRRNLYARERNARWARAHRGVSSSNPWLAGAPPFAAHLPGASMTMGFDPLPRWPVELRNTRGLHGLLTSLLGLPHAHHPQWALRPWQSGWAVHWMHARGLGFAVQEVGASLYERPTRVAFGPAVYLRAPQIATRGRRRLRLDTVTPVVRAAEGKARPEVRPSTVSLGHALDDFAHRVAPSAPWFDWTRARIRVEAVEVATEPAHVELGAKYGMVHGWQGSLVVECNAVAHWLLVAASRIGLGSRVAFGFGCVRTSEVSP